MTTELQESRNRAKQAVMAYAVELNKAGYNTRCIQDSIMVMALDVVLKE